MNGKTQKITVNTKGGLLAAFECAGDVPVPTEIELTRKSGVTIFWFLSDLKFNEIRMMKGRIRKIPAKELLA